MRSITIKQDGGEIAVSIGWEGEIAEILEIHAHTHGPGSGRLPKRDVLARIESQALLDTTFLGLLAVGDTIAAQLRLREIAVEIITPGLYPDVAESTRKRKGGDPRALRTPNGGDGEDRVLRELQTWDETALLQTDETALIVSETDVDVR